MHEAEECHGTKATTGCCCKQGSVSPDKPTTAGVLVALGTRSMDQFHTGRTPGTQLVAHSDAWRELYHLSVYCRLRCNSGNGSSTAPPVNCSFQLYHLQSADGAAAIADLSQYGLLHLLAQVKRTYCSGGLVLLREHWIVSFLSSLDVPASGGLLEYVWLVRLYSTGLLPGDVS